MPSPHRSSFPSNSRAVSPSSPQSVQVHSPTVNSVAFVFCTGHLLRLATAPAHDVRAGVGRGWLLVTRAGRAHTTSVMSEVYAHTLNPPVLAAPRRPAFWRSPGR